MQPQDRLNASARIALVAASQIPHQSLALECPEYRHVVSMHFTPWSARRQAGHLDAGQRPPDTAPGRRGGAFRQGSGQPGLETPAVRTGLLTGLKMLTTCCGG